MFRAVPCSSSGGQIVLLQPLLSSLSVNSHTVYRLRADSSYQLDAQFLYSITICMLHYNPQHASSSTFLDTRDCNNTICPPEDEQVTARNMLRIIM